MLPRLCIGKGIVLKVTKKSFSEAPIQGRGENGPGWALLGNNKIDEQSRKRSNDQSQLTNRKNITYPFYVRGKYKHGIKGRKCKFNHPNTYQKLLKHGTESRGGISWQKSNSNPTDSSQQVNVKHEFNPGPNLNVQGLKPQTVQPAVPYIEDKLIENNFFIDDFN